MNAAGGGGVGGVGVGRGPSKVVHAQCISCRMSWRDTETGGVLARANCARCGQRGQIMGLWDNNVQDGETAEFPIEWQMALPYCDKDLQAIDNGFGDLSLAINEARPLAPADVGVAPAVAGPSRLLQAFPIPKRVSGSSGLKSNQEDGLLQRCCICLDDFPIGTMPDLGCHKTVCKPCAKKYLEDLIEEKRSVDGLICLEPGCGNEFPEPVIIALIAPAMYEELQKRRFIKLFPDIVICPGCKELAQALPEYAICGRCEFLFCTGCDKAYHMGFDCNANDVEKKQVSMACARDETEEQRRLGQLYAVNEKRQQNVASENLIKVIAKKCPNLNCGADIQRSDGCNCMHCTRCRGYFCYKCVVPVGLNGRNPEQDPHFRACKA